MNRFFSSIPFFKRQKEEGKQILEEAKIQAKEILLKAREEALHVDQEAESGMRKATQELAELEKSLHVKEASLEGLEKKLHTQSATLETEKKLLVEKKDELLARLEKVAQLTQSEAKDLILRGWEEKLKGEIARRIKAAEEEIKITADEKAKEILVDAMRYGAVDYTAEYTLSTINLPSEDYKGRIIGKEGRNIRAFELATGVDVDLEEEGVIKISSFDAVKREIARVSLEQLIKDGRIQPARIEEIVHKTKQEIDRIIARTGEELCHKVGVYDLPRDLMSMLGKFKYRYSYGQNMILHTLEETKIGIGLAHELKADVNTVKLGCLLHDIGKIVTDKEGSHVTLGVDLLKKHNIPQNVIDVVASHHEDIPFSSVEGVIVYIADAVSGGRPGARHEDFEQYLKRLKTIEEAASKHKGVLESYALQAGRELRVIVRPEAVSDEESVILAQKIKADIEEKFPTFPGQVSITVIRETRAVVTTHS